MGRQVARLTDAIALGAGDVAAIVTRLQNADRQRQELARELQQLEKGPVAAHIDWRATERLARDRLNDWRGLLSRQTTEGRAVLKEILVGPIRFTPFHEGSTRGYRFAGEAAIAPRLIDGVVPTNGNWRPHRDSKGYYNRLEFHFRMK